MSSEHTSTTDAAADAAASRPALDRRWWLALAGLLVLAAVQQGLILAADWHDNVLARVPLLDADEYWHWAGRIADGQLIDDMPFMSAPLYPYLAGLVRVLGGGLLSLYVLQAGLRVATLGLIAVAAGRRLGPAVGLLAGALFLLLLEPAYFADRVLNCTLQLFLVAWLYLALAGVQQRPGAARWLGVGALLGLNCLANPPMLLAVVLVALWAWSLAGWRGRGLGHGALAVASAALVISPATWHNYRASGELIPISAQAGVTFAQGNNPEAVGVYSNIAGVSASRRSQNIEALRFYRHTTGEQGGWNATNRFFFKRGLDFWRQQPARAMALLQTKLYWFVSGRAFGDIYNPEAERRVAALSRLALAPLPLAWLVPPALLALLAAAKQARRYGPELILLLVPLVVVVAFWYSPRYRLPATVSVVVGAAWAIRDALHWRRDQVWSLAVLGALALGVYLPYRNAQTGFDAPDSWRAFVHSAMGVAYSKILEPEAALEHYRKALQLKPDDPVALQNIGRLLTGLKRYDEAAQYYRRLTEARPRSPVGWEGLATALLAAGRDPAQAVSAAEQAVQFSPQTPRCHALLAEALRAAGRQQRAVAELQRAIRMARDSGAADEAQRYQLLLQTFRQPTTTRPAP